MMRLASLVVVLGLGVSWTALANPGPHGDDAFHTAPEPEPKPSEHLGLGVALLTTGLVSFTAGAGMQSAWAIFTCSAGVPDGCVRERRLVGIGTAGVALMVVGVGAAVPGAVLIHRARKDQRSKLARLRPVLGFGSIGLAGRF